MHRLFLFLVVITACFTLVSCGGMDAEEVSRQLTHRYEGDGVSIQLQPGTGGQWTGTLSRDGVNMPVTATLKGTSLTGNFTHNGATFAFDARLRGDTLTIKSGGQTMALKDTAVNPLADASSTPINPLTGKPDGTVSNPLGGGTSSAPTNPPGGGSNAATNPLAGGGTAASTPPGGSSAAGQPFGGGNSAAGQAFGGGGSTGPGTTIQADVPYTGPKRLDSPATGVSFDLPSGWEGSVPGGIPLMVMAPTDGSLFSLAWAKAPATGSDVQSLLAEPMDLGNGAVLQFSNVQVGGGRIEAQVSGRGRDGRQLSGAIRGGLQGSTAVTFLVVGSPDRRSQVDSALNALMQSVRFTQPKAGEMAGQLGQYRQMLGGTQLEIYQSETLDGGFSHAYRRWDFCSNGQYQYSQGGSVGVSVDVPDYSTGGNGTNVSGFGEGDTDSARGTWSLEAAGTLAGEAFMVTLHDQVHGTSSDMIAPTQNGVFFRGEIWAAKGSPLCQ